MKNYITPKGMERLKNEALQLIDHERPELVKVVQWAASNGDRSENGDYIYGKKRLREIDKRIRFLTKKLDSAVVIDPGSREPTDEIFFGATVSFIKDNAKPQIISIVGVDEADAKLGHISWVSPLGKALLRSRLGDTVYLELPSGQSIIEIINVSYQPIT